jgi:hypothetical protein
LRGSVAEGTPPASIRKALTLLQGMLERAVEWGAHHEQSRAIRPEAAKPAEADDRAVVAATDRIG